MSFGARELVTQAKWWEGESSASGWQVPSPWHEYFLLKPFLVMLWVLLVPGSRSSSVWLALPYKSRRPWPSVCNPVLEGSGLYAEQGPQSLLGFSRC